MSANGRIEDSFTSTEKVKSIECLSIGYVPLPLSRLLSVGDQHQKVAKKRH